MGNYYVSNLLHYASCPPRGSWEAESTGARVDPEMRNETQILEPNMDNLGGL